MQIFKTVFQLIKPRITIASSLTAAIGYTMARGKIDLNILPVLLGGFLLASASAAINQIQEADIDAKVSRTANRPIPSGKITKIKAFIISVSLMIIGSAILYYFYDWHIALLGISAAILYNGIYTPMKRISPIAAIPGALIGAIPPLVGWLAAEGRLIDPRIYYLSFFFFIWQIPHFWLLLLFYSDQYKNNRLPSLFDRFTENKIKILTFTGIAATSVTGMLLPNYLLLKSQLISFLIPAFGVIVLIRSISLLKNKSKSNINIFYRKLFMDINIYALVVTILIISVSII